MRFGQLVAFSSIRPPIAESRPPDGPSQDGMRLGITGLNFDGAPQQCPCLLIWPLVSPVDKSQRSNNETPRVDALRRLARRPDTLLLVQVRLDRSDDVPGDLILHGEDVTQIAVVPFRPDVLPGLGVNELSRHADPATGGSHAAFEDVTDRQVQGDLPNVNSSPLVSERRVARDHEQPA